MAWAPRKLVLTVTGRSFGDPAGNAQHAEFGVPVQAVAGLDLNGRDAFGNQGINPR